ncbi:Ribonuclease P protein subunit p25-like protein [Holothuria leucospilota]|uniref:Ribonuclease P protein subunit p25-like protein n=1 Tax=Holothuria leucospilota TaxID=206669 RepID=A0A9Q1BFE4_HOLLE|nr:Ribonuclease P protein subunit p25-like protein [Holothuria leucospilota]
MENYTKGETVDVTEEDPFAKLNLQGWTDRIKMNIHAGGKIRNYIGFASKEFKKEERRLITFSGSGDAVSKVISCVEIMKRNHKGGLHQITKIFYTKKEDLWEPKKEDLDRLKVTRHIPAISVLLSKDQLDTNEPGYQAPGSFEEDWGKSTAQANAKRKNYAQKRRSRLHQPRGPASSAHGSGRGDNFRGKNSESEYPKRKHNKYRRKENHSDKNKTGKGVGENGGRKEKDDDVTEKNRD